MTPGSNPFQAPTTELLDKRDAPNSADDQLRLAHLKHEASIQGAASLWILGGGLGLFGAGSALLASVVAGGMGLWERMIFLALGAIWGGMMWVGIKLRALDPQFRIPGALLAGFGLIGFPVGTLISGYILWLLLSAKGVTVLSDPYREIVRRTPHIKYKTSIIVWIALGLVLLVIAAGVVAAIVGK